ncbi:hypothetical protein [Falsiroseomonas sp.]|uniref:hypothetical protein n=1 Tax=Falsiroseomonas sp. TaxID=2870721 RepID=UPI003F70BEA3
MTAAVLKVQIAGYWISATGRGRAAVHDAETALDHDRLPMLPARHLKGLVRDAMEWLETQGGLPAGRSAWLLGDRPERGHGTAASRIALANAVLGAAARAAILGAPDERLRDARRDALFQTLASTAIEPGTGMAADQTLRVMRVAVPLTLEAELRWTCHEPDDAWVADIAGALPLVRAVGAKRHRGLGRALLTISQTEAAA